MNASTVFSAGSECVLYVPGCCLNGCTKYGVDLREYEQCFFSHILIIIGECLLACTYMYKYNDKFATEEYCTSQCI